jgi:hypothetical protein
MRHTRLAALPAMWSIATESPLPRKIAEKHRSDPCLSAKICGKTYHLKPLFSFEKYWTTDNGDVVDYFGARLKTPIRTITRP